MNEAANLVKKTEIYEKLDKTPTSHKSAVGQDEKMLCLRLGSKQLQGLENLKKPVDRSLAG